MKTRDDIERWIYTRPPVRRLISRHFHRTYYYVGDWGGSWKRVEWLGRPLRKSPLDLWNYLEAITTVKPDLIVETGTFQGGSALFFASICDLNGIDAEIVTIELDELPDPPEHPRITYLSGSSTSSDIVDQVRQRAAGKQRVMVVLDSDHSEPHVTAELGCYADLVTPGSYLIVEDTGINGHPTSPAFGPGPMEAARKFLASDTRFERDLELEERQLMTLHPSGWLRRR